METFEKPDVHELIEAIVSLEGIAEAQLFLRDLLTIQELNEFSKRWRVARMLNGGCSYAQIEQETGLSSTTIARISKWLQKGTGGYQKMLTKMEKRATLPGAIEVAITPDAPAEETLIQQTPLS
jgi:TrpR-related protein YerC/YecD